MALAAGCAHFTPQPPAPERTAAALEARSLTTPEFQVFLHTNLSGRLLPGAPMAWDFEELFLAAVYFHPSLEVARADWAVARGGERTAAGRPNPTVSAVPGYDLTPQGATPWFPALTFDVPIEVAGKRGYRRAQAKQLSEAARWNIAAAAWQVRAGLRTAWLDLAAARARESRLAAQLALQEQVVTSLEQRQAAGALAATELLPARIARDKTRLDWLEAKRQAGEALTKVAEAVGVPVAALGGLTLDARLAEAPTAALPGADGEARRQALLGRADIRSALAAYEATQAALQLEIAKQYPDLHLGPGYQFDQGDHKISLSLTAELPILNQNQGPIAEAGAKRAAAAARLLALQAHVIADLDRAEAAATAARAQLAALDGLSAAQQKQQAAVAAQVAAGAADPLDLLTTRLELGLSELARLEGRVKLQAALGALEDAWQQPLAALRPELIETSPLSRQTKESNP